MWFFWGGVCEIFFKLHKLYGLTEENVLDRRNTFPRYLNAHIVENNYLLYFSVL